MQKVIQADAVFSARLDSGVWPLMKVHAWTMFLLFAGQVQADRIPAPVVTFDMPHGGCRLSVNSDGSGSLAYGALAAWVRVKPGTFEPEVLAAEFREVAIPRSEGEHPRPPGSVKFSTSEELFWFGDKELARVNFLKAFANTEVPQQMEAGAAAIEQTCREL